MRPELVHPGDLDLPGTRPLTLIGILPPKPRLAIVGSRAAHRRLRAQVPVIVDEARRCGWSIVSGGALGIDGDAHRTALAAGVAQIAVLPCGPDRPYPPDHAGLFDAMVRGGAALLFAQPVGTLPARAMFASRNRLVVGLSSAVVVVEAAARSGTMLTGRLALRTEVPLAAVTGSRGAAQLIAAGARSLPGDDADALRRGLRGLLDPDEDGAEESPWPERLVWLREALRRHTDRGAAVGALGDAIAASIAIAEAEALGLVSEVVPGRWVAVR